MELRYLRYFVAVAENRSFTRAAEILGISQPPLSQQIKKLEDEIGTPLLRRLTRSVELTLAGEAFYQDARHILDLSGHALERTRGIARGISGQLSIGFASSTAFLPQIFQLLSQFQQNYPAVSLQPREADMVRLLHDLEEGLLDAAFVRLPCESSKAFNLKVITSEKMLLVLPSGHHLSGRTSVSLGELHQDPLVIFPREVAPSLYEVIISACLRAGFQPSVMQQSPQVSSAISMVAAGFGVAIVPASLSHLRLPGITYHQIEDTSLLSDIALAWRRLDRSPAVQHLIQALNSPQP